MAAMHTMSTAPVRRWSPWLAGAALAVGLAWALAPSAPPAPAPAPPTAAPAAAWAGAASPFQATPAAPPSPAPAAPAAAKAAIPVTTLATPAPSVEVAPGVHHTPMGVPPGSLPQPAGPRPTDSEPEN